MNVGFREATGTSTWTFFFSISPGSNEERNIWVPSVSISTHLADPLLRSVLHLLSERVISLELKSNRILLQVSRFAWIKSPNLTENYQNTNHKGFYTSSHKLILINAKFCKLFIRYILSCLLEIGRVLRVMIMPGYWHCYDSKVCFRNQTITAVD